MSRLGEKVSLYSNSNKHTVIYPEYAASNNRRRNSALAAFIMLIGSSCGVAKTLGNVTGYEEAGKVYAAEEETGINLRQEESSQESLDTVKATTIDKAEGSTPYEPESASYAYDSAAVGNDGQPLEGERYDVLYDNCLGGTYHGWWFASAEETDAKIDSIEGYSEEQKNFLKFSVRAVCQLTKRGAKIAPNIVHAQFSVEGNSGTDTLASSFNMGGVKASEADIASGNFIEVWTKEDYNDGRGLVREKHKFKVYDSPMRAINDYAEMIGRLKWYKDAMSCRNVDGGWGYAAGLQHLLDQETCQVIAYQNERDDKGRKKTLSYATVKNYEEILRDRANTIKVGSYIIYVGG